MSEFKAGDLVELKSGSPTMTVNKVDDENKSVEVIFWVIEQQDFQQVLMHQHVLNNLSN